MSKSWIRACGWLEKSDNGHTLFFYNTNLDRATQLKCRVSNQEEFTVTQNALGGIF